MKKLWDIKFSDTLGADIRKKIRKVLRPHHDVLGSPQKCEFCGTDTTWTINRVPVCPKCAVGYKFLGEQFLLDPCEVCGKQGEWCTDGEPQHFLCFYHRERWFNWDRNDLNNINHKKQPELWNQTWDKVWSDFVSFMKARSTGG